MYANSNLPHFLKVLLVQNEIGVVSNLVVVKSVKLTCQQFFHSNKNYSRKQTKYNLDATSNSSF